MHDAIVVEDPGTVHIYGEAGAKETVDNVDNNNDELVGIVRLGWDQLPAIGSASDQ